MAEVIQSCRLHFVGGNSDKIYELSIEQCGATPAQDRYRVLFGYGRRGSELRRGEKSGPVSLSDAISVYDKYLNEKTGEGYRVIDSQFLEVGETAPRLFICPRCRTIKDVNAWDQMKGFQVSGGERQETERVPICNPCSTRVRAATPDEIRQRVAETALKQPEPSAARARAEEARKAQAARLQEQLERDRQAANIFRPGNSPAKPAPFGPARRKYRE
jgi:hypothetical protein